MDAQPHTAPEASPTEVTLGYYARNAAAFAASTADVEFSAMQDAFAAKLPRGASVLDFGCGSGRDAKRFAELGFSVTATDGSPELCAIARRRAGVPVRCELFQDLADVQACDGIWACSSILHLPKSQLSDVFSRMLAALKPNGVIYASFKHGDFEGLRNGRHFTDFTEPSFRAFLSGFPQLAIENLWVTSDVRPGRGDEKWLNLLLRKTQD